MNARECGCEGDLERCVHFDDRWLIMHPIIVGGERYGWFVCEGVGPAVYRGINHCEPTRHRDFSDYDDALAAFYEAEAKLLERVEAPQ